MATKVIPRPERTFADQAYIPAIAKGLSITIGKFFSGTAATIKAGLPGSKDEEERGKIRHPEDIATINYPDVQREYPERFRGVHRLTHRADGSPRCVACLCCSTACPAQCIHIEPAEYPEGHARRGYERFPEVFVIDELRCIFCGYCVEACPCDAIRMDTNTHMPPSTERAHFIYDKETLMSIPGRDGTYITGNSRHEPGDPSHPGLSRDGH